MEKLRLPGTVFQQPETSKKVVAPRESSERFIKGPIPISWLVRARSLPGEYTLLTALVLFYVRGMKQSKKIVVERYHFNLFEIKKDSARRALDRLQKAGLIEYEKFGHKFVVTIKHLAPEE